MGAHSARTCATTGATPARAGTHARARTTTTRTRAGRVAESEHPSGDDGRTGTANGPGADPRSLRSDTRAAARSGDLNAYGAQRTTRVLKRSRQQR